MLYFSSCNIFVLNEIHLLFSLNQTTPSGVYSRIHEGIESYPDNVVPTADAGFIKVREEKFAFISDQTMLMINASNDCTLTLIGERFYETGFGLAVPEGWPYKKYFDAVYVYISVVGVYYLIQLLND